jgi:tetratricopeptide (TPR) repeat protein
MTIASSAQQSDSAAQQHFLAAQQDQARGRLDAAVEEYKAVLRVQPRVPEAYMNLGLVYYAQARFADSAQALATAAKLRPAMRGVGLWLGIDEVKLYHPAHGATLLREAVRQEPDNKLAHIWLGTALWDAGQIDASLAELHAAAARFPDDPDLLFALGEAYGKAVHQETDRLLEESEGTALSDRIYGALYAQEHDWPKAEGHLRRALVRDPKSLDTRIALAGVYVAQGRLPDAEAQLDPGLTSRSAAVLALGGEVLILSNQTAPGLSRIAAALALDRGEALDAMDLPPQDRLRQASDANSELATLCRQTAAKIESDPTHGIARDAALAALYVQAGDLDAAARAYRSFEQAAPVPGSSTVSPPTTLAQVMSAYHLHLYEQSETRLLKWIEAHPADREARYDLIRTRRQLSMAQIARLIAIAPGSYHVHQLLGQLYVDREEDDKALAEYQAVAAARPDLPDVHFWLGHLYWKHGDADHALAELTRQLELNPGHAEANGEMGTVLVAEDRPKDAIPHLELAIHSKPDLWPAYSQLGRAYATEKNYARAEAVLKRGLAHDPDGLTHYQLGLVLRAEGKTAEAAQAFAQVRAIKNEKMSAPFSDEPNRRATQ